MKNSAINYVLGGCLALAPATTVASQNVTKEKRTDNRPNIILILADDMGRECIGTYGSTYNTPNLDRLAEVGIKFNNGFSQPLSTPSRVQLMTGKYNNKNYSKFEFLNQTEKTFANLAKDAGYTTMIAGKWQLGMNKDLPKHFGFDRYCLWNLNYKKMVKERYAGPLIEQDGKIKLYSQDEYGPDIFADYLLQFVEENQNKPFFAYYSMVLTHDPFYPTPDTESWTEEEDKREVADNSNFPKMVEYTDKIVGRILAKLDQLKLADNTIVIFVGDNGTARYIEVPMKDGSIVKGGKGMTKDTGVRVPLIMNWGKYKYQNHVSDDMVDFTDFLPTMADAMAIKVPEAWNTDGVSFLPQLKGEKGNPREWVFCHYDPVHVKQAVVNKWAAQFFRDKRYKLYSDGRFFDTVADPDELNAIEPGKGSAEAEKSREKLNKEFLRIPVWKFGDTPVPMAILREYPLRDTSKPDDLDTILNNYK